MSEIGSMWHKWDLHVHTASSYDSKYNSGDHDTKLVSAWVEQGISAAAITDHDVIDETRIDNLRAIISKQGLNITVFPGVELRTDTASSNLHVIGMFSEKSDLHALAEDFRAFSRQHGLMDNPQNSYVSLPEIVRFVREEHHGLISVHDGKKSNGVGKASGLSGSKDDPNRDFKTLLRHDFRSKVDFLDTNSEQSAESLVKYTCKDDLEGLPVTVNSDIHTPAAYSSRTVTWMKAELTFDGLKEAFSQPSGRISFKITPEEMRDQEMRKHYTISKIYVKSEDGQSDWYGKSLQLELNPGLVAIIGNKGAGKSALADVIGLDGGSRNMSDASFLSKKRFNDKSKYGSRFSSCIQWRDGTTDDWIKLDQKPVSSNGKIEFLPQSYIEKIASSVDDVELTKEIQKIIFHALPVNKRLGQRSWNSLIEKLEQEDTTNMQSIRAKMHELNSDIFKLEEKLKHSYTEEKQVKLRAIQSEIRSLQENPPKKPSVANIQSTESEQRQALIDKVQSNKGKRESKEEEQAKLEKFLLDLNKLNNSFDQVIGQIEEYNRTLGGFVEEYSEILPNMVEITTLNQAMRIEVNVRANTEADIIKKRASANARKEQLQGEVDKLAEEATADTNQIKQLDSKMTLQGKQQAQYNDDLETWKSRISLLKGENKSSDSDSERSLQLELQDNKDELPKQIAGLYQQRNALLETVLDLVKNKGQRLDELYLEAKQGIDVLNKVDQRAVSVDEHDTGVKFVGSIEPISGYVQKLIGNVDGRKSGKLKGSHGAATFIKDQFEQADLSDSFALTGCIEEILYQNDGKSILLDQPDFDELAGIFRDRIAAYDYLYGLEFLNAELRLVYNGRPLPALSAGEKGLVLLIFYLGLSQKEFPLVIDQPEDNLDNQSIFKHLVPYLRYAKTQRQIIVVTHNPNIAIAADADQVIVAKMNKEANTFQFESGALEDKHINTQIVDVLEGTKPAFDLRDRRYSLFE
ncbi:TrlF family AAA-like ATPase [Lacticaseibacillus paracasei]|uniref:TrlF family AAA-like ATPase n=1 Tax=Lacticaseibacillus paracasei TaxID=1597 RepID=UPI002A59DE8F|nr:hypothetical protein [Lacticaseibacillus paracasei]MDY0838710.1 hypothetical protein [Lacticaseibacillus paracasei]